MKTVIDIPPKNISIYSEESYKVDSIRSIFEAIEHALSVNPNTEVIKIEKNAKINIIDLTHNHGLQLDLNYSDNGKIHFRGYSRWVYFLGDKPVHFDSLGCMTDTPSHMSGWNNEFFNSLKFDSFKKMRF